MVAIAAGDASVVRATQSARTSSRAAREGWAGVGAEAQTTSVAESASKQVPRR
jgi:hypothetical protein